VDHNDNLSTSLQRFTVASLLVGTVPIVPIVNKKLQAEFPSDLDRFIGTAVIDQNNEVDHVVRQFCVRHMERSGRVVGGHDHDNFVFALQSYS
jgi:hypothetical protein